MQTYQDYERALREGAPEAFLRKAIAAHMASEAVSVARAADAYDRQRNLTVTNYTKFIAEHSDNPLVNVTAANNRIPSNFFHQLNSQRCAYLLGNGVSFTGPGDTKRRLGPRFDRDIYRLARLALIHGESFGFWNCDRLHVFPLTEFAPLYDARSGALRAGVRYWRLERGAPLTAMFFDESGVTEYRSEAGDGVGPLYPVGERTPYLTYGHATPEGGFLATGAGRYPALPVIRMAGSDLRQSTLVGLRQQIDAYDLIQSGFANDLQDCAQIYWIIENCGGMRDKDLRAFLNTLTRDHVAAADTRGMGGGAASLKPYVQEVPFESRMAWLNFIRKSIYEGFGALDVHALSSGSRTATEIAAAYQPLDAAADELEWHCSDAIRQLLDLLGIDDEPVYQRSRVADQYEQTRTVMLAEGIVDRKTLINHLPWLTVDEREALTTGEKTADEREAPTAGEKTADERDALTARDKDAGPGD